MLHISNIIQLQHMNYQDDFNHHTAQFHHFSTFKKYSN